MRQKYVLETNYWVVLPSTCRESIVVSDICPISRTVQDVIHQPVHVPLLHTHEISYGKPYNRRMDTLRKL